MLKRLFVQNYALIEKTEVLFESGLTILTGETGAGKSLLVDAIGLILGDRVDNSTLLNPNEKCVIEAEFGISNTKIFDTIEEAADLEIDKELIIRREINPNGKGRAFINDTPVTLSVLRSITSLVVDLHSQNEGQQLLLASHQLQILDQYAGIENKTAQFGIQYNDFQQIDKQLHTLRQQEADAQRQLEFYQYQLDEFQKVNINVEEEAQLEQEISMLEHSGVIAESLLSACNTLSESEGAVVEKLTEIIKTIEKIAGYSTSIATQLAHIQDAKFLLVDASNELLRLSETTDLDPKRLELLQSRQNEYNKLKHRYKVKSVLELIEIQKDFENKASIYQSIDIEIERLEKAKEAVIKELTKLGLVLEKERIKTAKTLSEKITKILQEVGFNKATFAIQVDRLVSQLGTLMIDNQPIQVNQYGINSVDFKIQTNLGIPIGELSQIASGGELSRVMLAIKTVLAEKMLLSVLIFDEIDTGISGEVAFKVGNVISKLAQNHQVITITHLPQIASKGNHHCLIFKQLTNNKTTSNVKKLNNQERIVEIAKMIGGDQPSQTALQNAKELLQLVK